MSIRVFLADDHALVRDGLRLLLETQPDIQVVGAAANGRDAIRQVAQLRPDIVFMDITMPELNGIDAAQQICAASSSTQVIILSVHSSSEHVSRALRAGARGYLLKESAGIEAINAVRTVYGGHRYLSQKVADQMVDEHLSPGEANASESPLERLSPREREIMQLVVEGQSSAEIACHIFLSPKTVETYRSRLMVKLGVKDLPSLVRFAIQHGLTPLE
jgi:DNA-binding NarL/FixJ family response regulator